jgi:putative transcriptional regulator
MIASHRGQNNMTDSQQNFTSLRDQFLVAMPGLVDGIFTGSVTYLCEHDEEGAMGIVINRPSSFVFSDLFEDTLNIHESMRSNRVLAGGPVQLDRGLIMHDGDKEWGSTMYLDNGLMLTSSNDIVEAIARNEGPENFLIMLGYAGWGPGQLEDEIIQNAWLTTPSNIDIIFHTPFHKRAEKALAQLGIDYHLISNQAGHA